MSYKADNFLQQVNQGHYYIYTIFNSSLYQHTARLFKHEKYILIADLDHLVKSFGEKLYICKKIAIMYEKVESSQTKESIWSIPIETANVCIFLQAQQFPMNCRLLKMRS